MAAHHKQGLCYNCDEAYVRGHKCAWLFYLKAEDYIVEEPDDDGVTPAGALVMGEEPPTFDPDAPLISLSAITGIRTEDTMQIHVHMGDQEFTTLIDSGLTHNFISLPTTHRAGLRFHNSGGAHVTVANGDHVPCRGLVRDVAIRIGYEFFTIDCYSIGLDCYDMILGTTWMRTLGPILWDFDDLCMVFNHNGRRVLWKGIGSTRTDIPPTGRLQARRLFTTKGMEPALLECLLDSYANVFAMPAGLPPGCPCDHRIHLKLAIEPIAVRP
jgi:hypothetical protein